MSIYVLLFLLLFTATIPIFAVKPARALQVATQWGYLYPNPPEGEADAEMWICDQIYGYFDDEDWGSSNAWGEYTQQGYVIDVLQYCQDPNEDVDWATIWWVGDFTHDGNWPPEHRACYGYNSQHTWDYNVYMYANYYFWYNPPYYYYWQPIPSKQYFAFIWTCANGGLYFESDGDTYNVTGITYPDTNETKPTYIPNNPFTEYGYVGNPYSTPPIVGGMPYGFTGTLGMSTDGYQNPDEGNYCYIGWENISPGMASPTGHLGNFYKNFTDYFYRYALGIDDGPTHHTIKQSLNYASSMACGYGFDFGDTDIYGGEWAGNETNWWYRRMRVLGNADLYLPY